jgi:hypothetical protein
MATLCGHEVADQERSDLMATLCGHEVADQERSDLMATLCGRGRHAWLSEEDAAKCCNGWHRELRVGDTRGCDRVAVHDGVLYGYVWVRDEGQVSPSERGAQHHDDRTD